jgi:hypothetical protein
MKLFAALRRGLSSLNGAKNPALPSLQLSRISQPEQEASPPQIVRPAIRGALTPLTPTPTLLREREGSPDTSAQP